ncbi:hypothetical protein SDC9_91759 [bioreactor metagenome]|uniref:Uncharacterized protein n=1 Tax=bioreactor metagenome TaxID=1076179 RepID=A0A645A5P3_9ZZZZ
MNGRDQPNEQGGIGHIGDEEGNDGSEGRKSKTEPKKASIQKVEDQVVNKNFAFGVLHIISILPQKPRTVHPGFDFALGLWNSVS